MQWMEIKMATYLSTAFPFVRNTAWNRLSNLLRYHSCYLPTTLPIFHATTLFQIVPTAVRFILANRLLDLCEKNI